LLKYTTIFGDAWSFLDVLSTSRQQAQGDEKILVFYFIAIRYHVQTYTNNPDPKIKPEHM